MTKSQVNVYVDTKSRTIHVDYSDSDIRNRLQYNIWNNLFFHPFIDWESGIDDYVEYWFKLTRARYMLMGYRFPKYIKIIKTHDSILGDFGND